MGVKGSLLNLLHQPNSNRIHSPSGPLNPLDNRDRVAVIDRLHTKLDHTTQSSIECSQRLAKLRVRNRFHTPNNTKTVGQSTTRNRTYVRLLIRMRTTVLRAFIRVSVDDPA